MMHAQVFCAVLPACCMLHAVLQAAMLGNNRDYTMHRALLAPVVRGAENIPDGLVEPRGVLFVGNHTRFGLYDLPFLMMELHLRGHNVRALSLAHTAVLVSGVMLTSVLLLKSSCMHVCIDAGAAQQDCVPLYLTMHSMLDFLACRAL